MNNPISSRPRSHWCSRHTFRRPGNCTGNISPHLLALTLPIWKIDFVTTGFGLSPKMSLEVRRYVAFLVMSLIVFTVLGFFLLWISGPRSSGDHRPTDHRTPAPANGCMGHWRAIVKLSNSQFFWVVWTWTEWSRTGTHTGRFYGFLDSSRRGGPQKETSRNKPNTETNPSWWPSYA